MPRQKFDPALLPPSPDLAFEGPLWARGVQWIAGIDEAGRGALAGPVCAAAVVLPASPAVAERLAGVRDSKQLSAARRTVLAALIRTEAAAWGVGYAQAIEVDTLGIVPATRLAVRRALLEIDPLPDHLLVDHLELPAVPIPQTALVKGDRRSLSIAAASILAKTARDAEMDRLAARFPGFGWRRNKGYGTAAHLAAIRKFGPTEVHRQTFAPIKIA